MEPTHESNHSAEFDKNVHHILDAEDVVFALETIDEPEEHGVVSDIEYIQWVRELLRPGGDGFGLHGVLDDAEILKGMLKNGYGDIYAEIRPNLEEIIKKMKGDYQQNAEAITEELNGFLGQHPGLFLWSEDPNDPLLEIGIETTASEKLQPVLKSFKLYMDINKLSPDHRKQVAEFLSL